MSDNIKKYVKDASKVVYKKVEEEFISNSSFNETIGDLKLRSHVGKKLEISEFSIGNKELNDVFYQCSFEKRNFGNLTLNDDGTINLEPNTTYKIDFGCVVRFDDYYGHGLYIKNLTTNTLTPLGVVIGVTHTENWVSNDKNCIPYRTGPTQEKITIQINEESSTSKINYIYNCSLLIEEIGREVLINEVEEVAKNKEIEDTPVGSILGTLSLTAPAHYLICDGTEYNIEDYPKLAQYFKDTLGSVNYYGGDGVNTFAVPDFRGEFIRGYDATNIRDPEGSTREIGKHQDATKIPYILTDGDAIEYRHDGQSNSSSGEPENADGFKTGKSSYYVVNRTSIWSPGYSSDGINKYTSRPTNVNVLWCIKYEPTYFMNYSPQYAGFDSDILFEGEANAIGEYILNGNIDDYDLIYVSCNGKNSSINGYESTNTIYVNKILYGNKQAYRYFMCYSSDVAFCMDYSFKDNNTLKIDTMSMSTGSTLYVSKIIGVKSGSNSLINEKISDEQIDNDINEIWSEVDSNE